MWTHKCVPKVPKVVSKCKSKLTLGWFVLILCTWCFWTTLQRFCYISLVCSAPICMKNTSKADLKNHMFFTTSFLAKKLKNHRKCRPKWTPEAIAQTTFRDFEPAILWGQKNDGFWEGLCRGRRQGLRLPEASDSADSDKRFNTPCSPWRGCGES